MEIALHEQCDLATALFIYWASQPQHVYGRYGSVEGALEDHGALSHPTAVLLKKIEDKAIDEGFCRNLDVPDLSCFLDQQPDYGCLPLCRMPRVLRI